MSLFHALFHAGKRQGREIERDRFVPSWFHPRTVARFSSGWPPTKKAPGTNGSQGGRGLHLFPGAIGRLRSNGVGPVVRRHGEAFTGRPMYRSGRRPPCRRTAPRGRRDFRPWDPSTWFVARRRQRLRCPEEHRRRNRLNPRRRLALMFWRRPPRLIRPVVARWLLVAADNSNAAR